MQQRERRYDPKLLDRFAELLRADGMKRRLRERPGTVIVPLALAFVALAIVDQVIGSATLHGVIVTGAGLGAAALVAVGLAVHRPPTRRAGG